MGVIILNIPQPMILREFPNRYPYIAIEYRYLLTSSFRRRYYFYSLHIPVYSLYISVSNLWNCQSILVVFQKVTTNALPWIWMGGKVVGELFFLRFLEPNLTFIIFLIYICMWRWKSPMILSTLLPPTMLCIAIIPLAFKYFKTGSVELVQWSYILLLGFVCSFSHLD